MNDPESADDSAPLATDEWPYVQVADRLEDRIGRGEFGAEALLGQLLLVSQRRLARRQRDRDPPPGSTRPPASRNRLPFNPRPFLPPG
jgi:hypothetical protein